MIRLALATAEPIPLAELVPGVAVEGQPADDEAAIERCLSGGAHVVLTAPSPLLGPTLDRLAAVARQAGVQLGLLNPDRYLPSRRLIRAQLDAGKLGDPGLVRIHRWLPAGGARDLHLRDLDVAIWLIGRAPDVVYALDTDCSRQLHLGFPGGAMALLDVATLPAGDGYRLLHLIGSRGAAYADDQQNTQLLYRGGAARALLVDEGAAALRGLARDAAAALAAGGDLSCTLAEWRRVAGVAAAARRSIETREAVTLEPT